MNSAPDRSLLIAAFVLLAFAAWAEVTISHISAASPRRQAVVTSSQALDVARAELNNAISKSRAKPPRKRMGGAERAFGTYLKAVDAVRAEIRARMEQIFAELYPSGELNTAAVPSTELLKSDPEKGKLLEEMEELDAQLRALGKEVEEFQLLVGKSDFAIASPDTTITTFPRNSSIQPFGFPNTASYGQVVTVPTNGDSVLTSFTFEMCQPNTINFRGYVFAWDGSKATGSALFISSLMNTGSTDCEQVTFNTGGIPLTAGQQYVLFASISQDCSGSGQGQWGARDDNPYSGGSFVYLNNGCDPAAWTSSGWSSFTIFDLAFRASFVAPCAITCPANITVANDPNQCGAVVNYPAPTTSGTCGTVTCSPVTGSFFPVGTTTVTCTSTAGPSCTFIVTVNDTQPPTILCPANVTAVTAQTCPISSSATVTYPAPTVEDNCPGVTSLCNPPSGSIFPVGTTTVTCTATDASGNTATCSFTVTVFSGCLQDDSNPANVVLFNAATGEYRFCCNGTVFTGVGTVIVKGCIVTIQHYPADRRVLIKFDGAVRVGTASLQSPPGSIKCTITDRNTRNNTCACQVSVGQSM